MGRFRQYALSSMAVFAAIAVGMVAGASGVGGRLRAQDRLVHRLEGQFLELERRLADAVRGRREAEEQVRLYESTLAGWLRVSAAGRLNGMSVTVAAPGSSKAAAQHTAAFLQEAGAAVEVKEMAERDVVPDGLVLVRSAGALVVVRSATGALADATRREVESRLGRALDPQAPAGGGWIWVDGAETSLGRLRLLAALGGATSSRAGERGGACP